MIRIGQITFEGNIRFGQKEISVIVPQNIAGANEEALKSAELLEIVNNEEVVGSYRLTDWKSEEKTLYGVLFTWQTVSQDVVDTLTAQINELRGDLASTNNSLNEARGDLNEINSALVDISEAIAEGNYSEAQAIIDILLGGDTDEEEEPEGEGGEEET